MRLLAELRQGLPQGDPADQGDQRNQPRRGGRVGKELLERIGMIGHRDTESTEKDLGFRALELHKRFIVIDTHADTPTDKPSHNGLSPLGKQVVERMNHLGMMVDISHVSDKTFYDVLEVSKAPVIASHSSCRALTDVPRNMNDDMIRALAKNGGVMQINFHEGFLDAAWRDAWDKIKGEANRAGQRRKGMNRERPGCR